MSGGFEVELIACMDAWDRAMVANDADAIGNYMADDWAIVGPDGSVGGKARFLEFVRSGDLTHDVMETHEPSIRVYGDVAIVVARGVSGGAYRGEPFYLTERVSSVFVRQEGVWRCVLTHLSQIVDEAPTTRAGR
jgi:ketosteroid isomerase-like protein